MSDEQQIDLPSLTAHVQGPKVLDPRTGEWVHSSNLALQVYDLLTNPVFRSPIRPSESLIATMAEWADEAEKLGLELNGTIEGVIPRPPASAFSTNTEAHARLLSPEAIERRRRDRARRSRGQSVLAPLHKLQRLYSRARENLCQ